ncbi:MAG: DUF2384 domain-containing protein [Acidobacteria bacterium]|nr:DUF2384 domain-containing protein [Acidobacteriota bacterium]
MTKLLEKAFKQASKLPLEEQRAIAKRWLQELGERDAANKLDSIFDKQIKELQRFFHLSEMESARLCGHQWMPNLGMMTKLYDIKKSLEALLKPDKIGEWLATPNPSLEGKTPREVIASGDAARVLEELAAVEWGGHN